MSEKQKTRENILKSAIDNERELLDSRITQFDKDLKNGKISKKDFNTNIKELIKNFKERKNSMKKTDFVDIRWDDVDMELLDKVNKEFYKKKMEKK